MLTPERIEELALEHEAFGFGRVDTRGLTTHGFDPEGMQAFARAVEAAARAEVEPLVRLGVEIVQQLIACHDEPGCAANDVGRDFVRQAGAWLSPQVGDKGDGNAHT